MLHGPIDAEILTGERIPFDLRRQARWVTRRLRMLCRLS